MAVYAAFLADMIYGERPAFDEALATVIALAKAALVSNPQNAIFPPSP